MKIHLLSILLLSLLVTGCKNEPEAPLPPELSSYAAAQQQCALFIHGDRELSGDVTKQCTLFTNRIEKNSRIADELATKELSKPEHAMKETEYARQRLKLKLQYEALCDAVQEATLAAIKRDDTDLFSLGVNFPGNRYIAPYYTYMESKAPRFDNDPHFLAYKHEESERLMERGRSDLSRGEKAAALVSFEKAALMGNPQAARSAALLYEEKHIDKAISWHSFAAENGITNSYLNLGLIYDGQGKTAEALEYYNKAAQHNNAEAQYQLYRHYLNDDKKRADALLKESAQNGYAQAQYIYALALMGDKKETEAVEWLKKASDNDHIQATEYLGQYYFDHRQYEAAFYLLAKSKSAKAFYLRGQMAENGLGTQKRYDMAFEFYSLSLEAGNKDAAADIERVKKEQSREQQRIAQAKERERVARMKAMVKECGRIPSPSAIKKSNTVFHITGTASAPVSGSHNFVIYGDDGEEYYLLRSKGIEENDRVDVSVRSTGRTISLISAEGGESRNVYQFEFIKSCISE